MDLLKRSKVQSPLKLAFMLTKYHPEWKDTKHKLDGVSEPADSPYCLGLPNLILMQGVHYQSGMDGSSAFHRLQI